MRRLPITAIAVGLVVGLAACGGDDPDGPGGVEVPPLASPLETEETSIGGGASPLDASPYQPGPPDPAASP